MSIVAFYIQNICYFCPGSCNAKNVRFTANEGRMESTERANTRISTITSRRQRRLFRHGHKTSQTLERSSYLNSHWHFSFRLQFSSIDFVNFDIRSEICSKNMRTTDCVAFHVSLFLQNVKIKSVTCQY